jgi:2-haloacid dehalogenase
VGNPVEENRQSTGRGVAVARVLVFDVMETLLDLRPLREPFARAFGDPPPVGEWFARLLHGSLVATVTGTYEDFGTIGQRALDSVAFRHSIVLSEEDGRAILETMRRLPPHPEVRDALGRLRSAGFPLATLTNSSEQMARAQLEHAGLVGLFDQVLSVEGVRRYKPAPEPYLMAADRLDAEPQEMRMVAAHDWDVWGAMRAGCEAAFVARGAAPFALGDPPVVVGSDLSAVAEAILQVDAPKP